MEKRYTIAEIADIYGLTKAAIYAWVRRGLKTYWVRAVGRKAYQVAELSACDKLNGYEEGTGEEYAVEKGLL
jgi:DNA-binding transcriptional MerR regulator